MGCKNSNFLIGLGIGSVVGALVYHFSRTAKAQKLESDICQAIHKLGGEAKDLLRTAEEKAMNAGTKAADKMDDEAHRAADRADSLKDKVHNFADNAKK